LSRLNQTNHPRWLSRLQRYRALLGCFSVILIVPLALTFVRTSKGQAAAGDLDPSFGSGGIVITRLDPSAMAIQADGKIVMVGWPDESYDGYDFALTRYNPDGTLDPTFGVGGHVFTDFGGNEAAAALAIQPNGKIVVAGTIFRPRSSVSGSITPDGTVTISCTDDFAVARYNANGSLDVTFDGDGKQTIDIGGRCVENDYASDLAILADGKIIVIGETIPWLAGADSTPDFNSANVGLACLTPTGSLDPTFGVGGTQITDFYPGLGDYGVAIAIQTVEIAGLSIERIVVGANTGYPEFVKTIHTSPPAPSWIQTDIVNHFTLARYDLNGQLDDTFGVGGRVVVEFDGQNGSVKDLAIQPDNKIVAVGGSVNQFALVRCHRDGELDQWFGDGWSGKVTTAIGDISDARAVALQSNGKIVVAGVTESYDHETADFALARYTPEGQLDVGFGVGGKLIADLTSGLESASAVAIQPDDKIVVAGHYNLLARFLSKPEQSDLQITNIEASNNSDPQGEKLTITATIANTGLGPAVVSHTEFVVDGQTVLGTVDTQAIAARDSATVTINWDVRGVKGEHTIRVTADKTGLIAESNEDNNAATLTVNVKGNKVTNGSFEQSNESGTSPAGWSGSNTGAGTTSWSEGGSDGSRSVSISGNGGNTLLAGSPKWTSDAIAVTPSEVLNLVVSARSYGASSPATAGLVWLDASGNVLGTVTALSVPLTTGGFATLEQLVTIPAGVSRVRVVLSGFSASDCATGGAVTFDEVGLFEN
jgi:uncharacterized delta-60 repeat protein